MRAAGSLVCLWLGLSALAAGCDGTSAMMMPGPGGTDTAIVGTLPTTGLRFSVVRGRGPDQGAVLPAATFRAELADADAVCLGEIHNDSDHHDVQLWAMQTLAAASGGRRLALGMEMVQRPFQQHLDDFAAGRIDEPQMLTRTLWATRWGYDYAFYRPTVNRALEAQAALLALNASKDVTDKVSRQGLNALTPEERAQLPEEIDLNDAVHRAWFEKAISGGGVPHERIDAIYVVQVVWDETMADTAARWWQAQPAPRQVLILAGYGHCMDRGIPARMRRRGVTQVVSLRPVADDAASVAAVVDEGLTDYVLVYGP